MRSGCVAACSSKSSYSFWLSVPLIQTFASSQAIVQRPCQWLICVLFGVYPPSLSPPSTPCLPRGSQDADARDKRGHPVEEDSIIGTRSSQPDDCGLLPLPAARNCLGLATVFSAVSRRCAGTACS